MKHQDAMIIEISEIILRNLRSDDSLNLILKVGFNEYIAQSVANIVTEIMYYLNKICQDQ